MQWRLTRTWFGLIALLLVVTGTAVADTPAPKPADPMDWPMWRGPEGNGISREKNLVTSWSPEGENLLWKSEELGGRSTPIVLNGKLYTLVRHMPQTLEECEKVICVDAATGQKLWENTFNAFLTDVPDTRVGWSSVVGDPATGHIYALGVCGYFQCIDGETGQTIWSRSLSEEYGLLTTYGGRTNFPVVFDNLVIISGVIVGWGEMARPAHRILAFDKSTGQQVWFQSTKPLPEDTTYSTPAVTVVNGVAQIIFGAGDGSMYGFQPRTGKQIWNYDVSFRGINTAPVVIGDKAICGHSEENLDDTRMGALFALDLTKPGNITKEGELWRNKEQFIGKCAPLVVNDRVYAVDDGGIMFICDLKTGKLVGKTKLGTMGRGSPVYGDGKIYCCDATGRWYIFEPSDKGVKKVHSLRLDVEVNASPIISHGRIYLSTETALYCIGNKDVTPEVGPQPALAKETPVEDDQTPAQLVLTPVEALVTSGQQQPLQALLYNSKGQFLKIASPEEVKFTVAGSGTVNEAGHFLSPATAQFEAAIVTANIGELKATARIRQVPALPWSLTFDSGEVPVTGIGLRYRHIGLDFDLWQDLKGKNPLAAKALIFLSTQFANFDRPALKIDDSTPAQAWTGFRRYLGLIEQTNTQAEAQALLDPALAVLKDLGVIASWSWTGTDAIPTQLTIAKGTRKTTGNGAMCKITTIPKGTRSQGWLGSPALNNYIIQADVYATKTIVAETADPNAKVPDIGIINQRYRLELMGASQQLKLYSWYPHDQKYYGVSFPWQTETWYTMKLKVVTSTVDGKLVSKIAGKVWKRDEAEPDAWSIEWTDSPGNSAGSPGLAGNSKDAEIFIDNLIVTPAENAQLSAK